MHLTYGNVNDAFVGLVHGIHNGSIDTVRKPSRVGDVIMVPEPVTITYTRPRERVLFNPHRDANPFFHLYESLWMLAGRNDVAPLAYYNSQIAEIASDDGETFNGAYGYRWRHSTRKLSTSLIGGTYQEDLDQLALIIQHLKDNPNSRRAVLQMWTVHEDLLRIDSQGYGYSKDVCCNLSVMFSINSYEGPEGQSSDPQLDMTVTNRSNDLIWGMLGANVVHFSMLQEYVACALRIEVGVYNQFTNNLHAYTSRWEPDKWLQQHLDRSMHDSLPTTYGYGIDKLIPLVQSQSQFDQECPQFVEQHKHVEPQNGRDEWKEPFLMLVAKPMCHAFHMHKQRDYQAALYWCARVEADDWRIAATQWILKRKKNWEKKH